MIRRAQTRRMLTRVSQPQRAASLLLVPSVPELELCNAPSIPSPQNRFFAWQAEEDDGERKAWFTHSLLLQPNQWQASTSGSTTVRLHRHPERHRVLQAGVSVKRHLSRIFPAHPRSLASVLVPGPAARRCSASHYVRPAGLGFQRKNLPAAAAPCQGRDFCLRSLHRKHISALGSGAPRVASRKSGCIRMPSQPDSRRTSVFAGRQERLQKQRVGEPCRMALYWPLHTPLRKPCLWATESRTSCTAPDQRRQG